MVASTYGWTHKEILDLSARQFFMYVEQVPKLLASRQLSRIEAASVPYMEVNERKAIFKYYEKILEYQEQKTPQKTIDSNWDLLRKGLIPND